MNVAQTITSVRALLDYPDPQSPTPLQVYEAVCNEGQLLLNIALNSATSHSVAYFDLTAVSGVDTYNVTAADFGKDVLIHTVDDSDPLHVERTIPRINLQSREEAYFGPKQAGGGGAAGGHSAQVFVFYRTNGVPFIQMRPQPDDTAVYRVWYETATFAPTLADSAVVPASHRLLVIAASLASVPYCKWSSLSAEIQVRKKGELTDTLAAQKREHVEAFRRYIATDRKAGAHVRRGFDDASYFDDQYGW